MNQRELKDLIEFLIEKDITEFELERGDVKVRIRRGGEAAAAAPAAPYAPATPAPASPALTLSVTTVPAAPPLPAAEEAGLHSVKSPIVGTYYDSPSPGSPPFVKVGDAVEAGQVLCIIEAMKLMNEIESDVAGELVKKLATNGQPVEYGQALFVVKPRG
ncbi:MAG: acetyl-CoA carboxylase biotin carboxyl carrier protein [Acidobacteriota bacterium]|nr:acetyl-CoA carboxylase biotin carboxyl carrier protein [Acidobacteriota bacterium]